MPQRDMTMGASGKKNVDKNGFEKWSSAKKVRRKPLTRKKTVEQKFIAKKQDAASNILVARQPALENKGKNKRMRDTEV